MWPTNNQNAHSFMCQSSIKIYVCVRLALNKFSKMVYYFCVSEILNIFLVCTSYQAIYHNYFFR